MNETKRVEIMRRAIEKYGESLQHIVLMEELAELIQAVSKYHRNGYTEKTSEKLIEEWADVQIMMTQLLLMHPEMRIGVELMIEKKLERLEARL